VGLAIFASSAVFRSFVPAPSAQRPQNAGVRLSQAATNRDTPSHPVLVQSARPVAVTFCKAYGSHATQWAHFARDGLNHGAKVGDMATSGAFWPLLPAY
jgi:hypothetical protein